MLARPWLVLTGGSHHACIHVLPAYWPLCDSDHDGYLTQAEMDKAVYGNVKPLELALRECFLTLPSLTKKQKKKFEKYMKYYTRDQEDYPNKLR